MGIFENAVIGREQITDYIPQRFPIVMVDEFFGIEDNVSYSAITVREDNLFMENGLFNESGILEHIAQSCALRVGYICKQENKPIPIGYIGAVKKMKIFKLPGVGEKLFTSVRIMQEVFDITLVTTEVRSLNDTLIASCEMKIFLEPVNV